MGRTDRNACNSQKFVLHQMETPTWSRASGSFPVTMMDFRWDFTFAGASKCPSTESGQRSQAQPLKEGALPLCRQLAQSQQLLHRSGGSEVAEVQIHLAFPCVQSFGRICALWPQKCSEFSFCTQLPAEQEKTQSTMVFWWRLPQPENSLVKFTCVTLTMDKEVACMDAHRPPEGCSSP